LEANHKRKEALTSKDEVKGKLPKAPNMKANLTLLKHAMRMQRGELVLSTKRTLRK
jgi:hypothetical protein